MTHELKTPISTIGLSSDVLKEESIINEPERLKNYANIISKENNRLKTQVERVLQLAQMDDQIILKKENVAIHDLIRDAVENVSVQLQSKNGSIEVNLDAKHQYIKADKIHIQNVIQNIIDNALKYCSNTPSIKIKTENELNKIEIGRAHV